MNDVKSVVITATNKEITFEQLNVGDYFEHGSIFLKIRRFKDYGTTNSILIASKEELSEFSFYDFTFYDDDIVNLCEIKIV